MLGPWPGDELIPNPAFISTRAVTVASPPATVWAWLVQMGRDRAGTYSYNLLENLLGIDTLNIEWIVPRFQQIAVGDEICMPTPFRFGGRGLCSVLEVEPERALVLGHGVGPEPRAVWAFLLSPLGPRSTRFMIRAHVSRRLSLAETIAGLFVEPAHFLMERQVLLGIKQRAEASFRRQRMIANHPVPYLPL
jgi:hypothetical protein